MKRSRRQSFISTIVIALVAGIVGLATVTSRPRFSGYATVDVLELLASGLCFGIAFAGIVRVLRDSGGG